MTAHDSVIGVIGIDCSSVATHIVAWFGKDSLGIAALVLIVEHGIVRQIIIAMIFHSCEITFAIAHSKTPTRGIKILTIVKWENTAVFQNEWIVKEIDIIVPLGNTLRLVFYIINKIKVQRVPLAVFPVTHFTLGVFTRDKIVITVTYNLTCILTVGELHNLVAHQVIDMALGCQHINLALATALHGFGIIVFARRQND